MLKKLLLSYLTKDLDEFSKELVKDVVNGHSEFRPAQQWGDALTLTELADMDPEYKQYTTTL